MLNNIAKKKVDDVSILVIKINDRVKILIQNVYINKNWINGFNSVLTHVLFRILIPNYIFI